LTFFEGNITLDLDLAEVFRGIGIFCRIFALKDFLSKRPLKRVWADPPTAVRFRVKQEFLFLQYIALSERSFFRMILN
jgi:hypothetical protein